jgi:hypothetical protein
VCLEKEVEMRCYRDPCILYVLNRIITDEGKSIVQGMDDDQDGLIERAEFVKHSTKLLSDPELARQVFVALDRNADGTIPIPEYLQVWGQWARAGRDAAEERLAARRSELIESRSLPVGKNCRPRVSARSRAKRVTLDDRLLVNDRK